MNIEQVRDFTLSLPGVTEDQPFGDDNITFRVEGKIFLCLWLGVDREGRARFACKLSPDRNEELRDCYEGIMPAFHWNKSIGATSAMKASRQPLSATSYESLIACCSAHSPKP